MTKPVRNLTQPQAAALLGVSARRLQQIAETDDTVPTEYDSHGRVKGYPPEQFANWLRGRWAKNAGVAADGRVFDEKIERARLLHHQANNEALKEEINRGELIPAPLVIELCSALVAASRTKVLALHSKLRSRFPGVDEKIANEVETLSHEALRELGSDGIPAELRRRIAPHIRRLESAADTVD